ncbi:Metaxin-like protein [Ceratocystis fimbriata CBS 114723]|uniref:Metaxin-like protein n=1 Tax=Ceratocystis fimbriata CBS 114723 TaxID=1035309 RepID=A0A2C5WZ04_9PEZI|nr:Metaxin-like protein [Ceratocystis fimbriata CBS 114723]
MPDGEFVLHIWGPAFGLASIDAECLAAVTLVMQTVSREGWKKWQIVASSDPSVCSTNMLPALHHDGSWICGYRAISRYLKSTALTQSGHVIPQDPDAVAFSAWLSSKVAVLLDLSLYVSASNWSSVTRPAYSDILPWPLTWSIPPMLRRDAIQRAERQGFDNLDIDVESQKTAGGKGASFPTSFDWRLPSMEKKSVLGEMTPEQQASIKLYDFSREALDVISRESKSFLVDGHVSPEGCLAYAYIALLIKPDVPQPWIRNIVMSEYPKLVEFANSVDALNKSTASRVQISTRPRTKLAIAASLCHQLVQEIPELGNLYLQEWRENMLKSTASGRPKWPKRLIVNSAVAIGTLGSLYFYLRSFYPLGRPLYLWNSPSISRLGQFGELGAMLGIAMGGVQAAGGYSSLNQRPGVVEDVAIDL